jgi:hypothetical protein
MRRSWLGVEQLPAYVSYINPVEARANLNGTEMPYLCVDTLAETN